MSMRSGVVEELREMFRQGATPSRLCRLIAEHHEGEADLLFLINEYFHVAFAVPIVRGLDPLADYRHDDLRLAHLNEQLLPAMVQHRGEWDDGDSWLEGLVASDPADWIRTPPAVPPPDLKGCWETMTPAERNHLRMDWASAAGLAQTVKILSVLCENLQQQVNELSAMPAAR